MIRVLSKDERKLIYKKLSVQDWEIWRYAQNSKYRPKMDIEHYAKMGYLELAKWARRRRCRWTANVCYNAVLNGHLHILEWARAQEPPAPWDKWICSVIAISGHLEILKWARAHGDENFCYQAARFGRLEMLQWALAQEPPAPIVMSWIYEGAIENGHLELYNTVSNLVKNK